MKNLLKKISNKISVSSELEQALTTNFIPEEMVRGKILAREKQVCRKLYFLEKGVIRTSYFHEEKEVTSWFYKEDDFFTSWYSFYTQQYGFEQIETLEDSLAYSISYKNYQLLCSRFHDFERFARLLAEDMVTSIDQYSKGYMFSSAKERYDKLLYYFPDVEQRVKLGHLASFLGITQETLSRIRGRK